MAYPIPIGSILSVTIESRVNAQQNLSVFHYRADEPLINPDGGATLDQVYSALAVAGGLLEKYLDCCSTSMVNVKTRIQWIAATRYAFRSYTSFGLTQGLRVSAVVAPNVAIAITKRNEVAGRHNVGTLHMPAVPTDFVTAGALNAIGEGVYALLQPKLVERIIIAASGVQLTPVIFNKAQPLASVDVSATGLNTNVRTMHRRTVGLGS